jgi:tetratricopeptide (TPR) repeat protein
MDNNTSAEDQKSSVATHTAAANGRGPDAGLRVRRRERRRRMVMCRALAPCVICPEKRQHGHEARLANGVAQAETTALTFPPPRTGEDVTRQSKSSIGNGYLKTLADQVGALRSLATHLVVFILVLALLGVVIWETWRETLAVEPVSVPAGLAERGYTPEIMASRLAAAMKAIQEKAATLKETKNVDTDRRDVDIIVPVADVSVRTIAYYLRQLFGKTNHRVSGDVTLLSDLSNAGAQTTNEGYQLQLVLRFDRSYTEPGTLVGSESNIDDLIFRGAIDALRMVDPYVYAAYEYVRERSEGISSEFTNTRKAIEDILRTPPKHDDAWAWNLWGNVLTELGSTTEAVTKYKNALSLDPRNFIFLNNVADPLIREGKYEDAIIYLRRSISIKSDFVPAYSNLGWALFRAGKIEEAEQYYSKSIMIDPTYAPSYVFWGVLLAEMKQYDKAYEKFGLATQYDSLDVTGWSEWGNALVQEGQFDKALEKLQVAVELAEVDSVTLYRYGWVLGKLEKHEAAAEALQRALVLEPYNERVLYDLSVALIKSGRTKEAKLHLVMLVNIDPEHTKARDLLKRVELGLHQ